MELNSLCVVLNLSACVHCSHPACSFNDERDALTQRQTDRQTDRQMTRREHYSSPTLRHSP